MKIAMNGKLIFYTAAVAILAGVLPYFFSSSNYMLHILIMILFFAYLSSCWNILGGFAGQHSLGHSAFVGLGAYTSTLLFSQMGVNPWLGMLLGGGVATLAGLFIGYLCFRYRVRGMFFVLVSIAFAEILNLIFSNTRSIGGASGLVVPLKQGGLLLLQFRSKLPYYYIILAMLVFVLALTFFIQKNRMGYYFLAIRENEEVARAVGIPVMKYKLVATAISTCLSAFGGTFYAQYTYFIDPPTVLGIGLSIEILIYPIVGGIGTVLGPLIGAALIYPIAELTRIILGAKTTGVHLMVYGGILIFIMIFAPHGIMGILNNMWGSRSQRQVGNVSPRS